MIVDALLWLVKAILLPVIALLPDSGGTLDIPDGSSIVGTLGEWAGPFDRYAPLSEAATMVEFVIMFFAPAAFAYSLAVWVWARIPFIGK